MSTKTTTPPGASPTYIAAAHTHITRQMELFRLQDRLDRALQDRVRNAGICIVAIAADWFFSLVDRRLPVPVFASLFADGFVSAVCVGIACATGILWALHTSRIAKLQDRLAELTAAKESERG